jgi:hypothetical protein
MKEDVFTDERLWNEVLEVLNDNRRELTDEEVASLLHERKVFPLRYVLMATAAILAIGFFLWPKEDDGKKEPTVAEVVQNEKASDQSVSIASEPISSEVPKADGLIAARRAPQKSRPERIQPQAESDIPTTDEPPKVELLEIDMEAVHQQGEDLRLAMAAMNNELFEME